MYKSFPSAYFLLGRAYLTQKNWKDAEATLKNAIALDPNSAEAYLTLALFTIRRRITLELKLRSCKASN